MKTSFAGAVKHGAKEEQELMSYIWSPKLKSDPLAFVMFAFPWGKRGTPLENVVGPRSWQRKELLAIKEHIRQNEILIAQGKHPMVYRLAVSSGRGIGKSALVAWLVLWMQSCHLGATTTVTANTETQLKSKTWAEVGKWHTLLINSHWFDRTALSLTPSVWFKDAITTQLKIDTGYYYAQALTWSEENPDSFAGTHSFYGQMLIMDEASGIPSPIFSVSEGFFTEPIIHRYWLCFSNPRRNSGEFFECFHKNRDYWRTVNVDSRTVEGVDVNLLQSIVNKFGEDSDEAKVEVKGLFPSQGDKQFISRSVIHEAVQRDLVLDTHAALMMGVDLARYGDDTSVIRFRQGRDGRTIPVYRYKNKDNMQMANECAALILKYKPDAVCIDAGSGSGVIDRLREMGFKVFEVWFGGKADDEGWANKRAELWARMRDWLEGACIDADERLMSDLGGPEYRFSGHGDKIVLESKDEMKKRGLASPDDADALACTFAVKVPGKGVRESIYSRRTQQAADVDYDIF